MKKLQMRRKKKEKKDREAILQNSLKEEKKNVETCQKEVYKLRSISRSFWERWQWEVVQRRKMLKQNTGIQQRHASGLHRIDPCELKDPNDKESYIGSGSFGIVQLKVFRGIDVAVKEFRPNTFLSDVKHEACRKSGFRIEGSHILAHLSHPFMPLLVGVCTSRPYMIVMQYYGLKSLGSICTMQMTIKKKLFNEAYVWITLTGQILEALRYMHDEAHIIQNGLKSDNLLVTDSFEST